MSVAPQEPDQTTASDSISVRLLPSDQPGTPVWLDYIRKAKGGWFVTHIMMIIALFLGYNYVLRTAATEVDCSNIVPGLHASVAYPIYLAAGDKADIRVTVGYLPNTFVNSQGRITPTTSIYTEPITRVLLVGFQGETGIHLDNETSNRMEFKGLAPGERRSFVISIKRNDSVIDLSDSFLRQSMPISFALRVVGHEDQSCAEALWSLASVPIYGVRTLYLTLGLPFLIAVGKLLWELFVKTGLGVS